MAASIYCGERLDDAGRVVETMHYKHDRHGLIIGPTGCGKSTSFIMANLLAENLNGTSQIVIDPKGEVACVCALKRARHGDVRIIDPFGVLRELEREHPKQLRALRDAKLIDSAGFNPLASLETASPSFYDDCAAIGEALIKVEGSDPHWAESAQGLITGLIMWEKVRHGSFANLANVRTMLTEAEELKPATRADGEAVMEAIAGLQYHLKLIVSAQLDATAIEAKGGTSFAPAAMLEIAASLVARFLEPTDETRSIISSADTQSRWLLSPLMKTDLGKPGIDFRDLKRKATCIFVVLPSSRLRTHSAWLRLVIVTALRRLYIARGVRTQIFVDEMPALGYLPPLVDAFALVRGYNIGLIGIAQDLNQLKALYKDHYESFIANAGYTICWGPNDLTTADWVSKRSSETTRIAPSVGSSQGANNDPNRDSTSYNESYISRRRYLPQELIGMARGEAIVMLAGVGQGFKTKLRHYKQMGFDHVQGFNPYSP